MKIKLLDILNSKDVLIKLGDTVFNDGLTSYKIARNIKKVNPEIETFELAKKNLIEKYGKKEGDTEPLPQKNIDEYNMQMNEILAQEVDIDVSFISPAKLSEISPFELMAIDWMLESEQV